jgi:hypothetical protein
MSLQDNINIDKELFSELTEKVKKSETVRISRAPIAPMKKKVVRKIFRFDALDIKMSFKEEDLEKYFCGWASSLTNEMVFVVDISEVVDMTVMDKSGKKLLTMNCGLYDDQGLTSELQINRFTLAKRLYDTIIGKAKEYFLKQTALKKEKQAIKEANKKIKSAGEMAKQYEQEHASIVSALRDIKTL